MPSTCSISRTSEIFVYTPQSKHGLLLEILKPRTPDSSAGTKPPPPRSDSDYPANLAQLSTLHVPTTSKNYHSTLLFFTQNLLATFQ